MTRCKSYHVIFTLEIAIITEIRFDNIVLNFETLRDSYLTNKLVAVQTHKAPVMLSYLKRGCELPGGRKQMPSDW